MRYRDEAMVPPFAPAMFAIHIADGVLGWPWLLGGFVVAGVLTVWAMRRLQEDEIPRVGLLTAAFFVASSIHVKLGPTSVHLLLAGLVGVILGWRAPLAILLGVFLQAVLIPHGGITTVGINAAIQMLPALVAAGVFPWLLALARGSRTRALLVCGATLVWGGMAVFLTAILYSTPWSELIRFTAKAGLVFSVEHLQPAWQILGHPVTLSCLLALAVGCTWLDWRAEQRPEFPAGAVVGALSVLSTTALAGVVLIADGADRWSTFATGVFLVHVPLALLEGLIVGVTVSFLARVKPTMVPGLSTVERGEEHPQHSAAPLSSAGKSMSQALLTISVLLALPSLALAHQLEAEAKIDLKAKRVIVETWYETGDAPKEARVKVLRPDGSILAEGRADERGNYAFEYQQAESLRVEITAPGGHRTTLRLKASDLEEKSESQQPRSTSSSESQTSRGRDLLLGLTFLLALASFVLSWRTAQRVQNLSQR